MGLESVTYVQDLTTSNPTASDLRAQGDDHIRAIKTALRNTFPTARNIFRFPISVALQTSDPAPSVTSAGTLYPMNAEAAARTITLPAGSGLYDGWEIEIVKADHSNFAVTIAVTGSDTVNGYSSLVLWQRYQHARVRWCNTASLFLVQIQDITPIGHVAAWGLTTITPASWVFCNGTTIGDASSSASQRANADCRGLFYHLWTNFGDTECPVSGGRGATNIADFEAHKRIGVPNFAGRVIGGIDTLGGISTVALLGTTTMGGAIGAKETTILQANLPAVNLSSASLTVTLSGNDFHKGSLNAFAVNPGSNTNVIQFTGVSQAGITGTIGGNVPLGGSGTAISRVPAAAGMNWVMKL